MNIRMSAALWVALCAAPVTGAAQAQMCDRKLSALDADVSALEMDYRASDTRMQGFMAAVDWIQDAAMGADICPTDTFDRTAQHRAEVSALDAAGLVTRSEADLQCGQAFVARVSNDIAAARSAGNSAMVVRLNNVSQRILALETRATQIAIDVAHLSTRRTRMLKALDLVDTHCGQMDSIYE